MTLVIPYNCTKIKGAAEYMYQPAPRQAQKNHLFQCSGKIEAERLSTATSRSPLDPVAVSGRNGRRQGGLPMSQGFRFIHGSIRLRHQRRGIFDGTGRNNGTNARRYMNALSSDMKRLLETFDKVQRHLERIVPIL